MYVNKLTGKASVKTSVETGGILFGGWKPVSWGDVVTPNFVCGLAAPCSNAEQKMTVEYSYENLNEFTNKGSVTPTGKFTMNASGGYPVATTAMARPILSMRVWCSGSVADGGASVKNLTTPSSTFTCWYSML